MTYAARNYVADSAPDWPGDSSVEDFAASKSAELDALAQTVTPQITPADLQSLIGNLHNLDAICDALWKTDCRKSRVRELYRKADEIESRLAQVFGAQRGWKLCKRFSWGALVSEMNGSDVIMSGDLPPFADHPLFYCDIHGPVAILAKEYNFNDSKQKECEQFAVATGIAFELPDFPSWHAPGTTLIVWRRK